MDRESLRKKNGLERAMNGVYLDADSFSKGLHSGACFNIVSPEFILEQINFLNSIPMDKPKEKKSGHIESRYQNNWYAGLVAYGEAANTAGYLGEASRAMLNAFKVYVKRTKLYSKERDKTETDVKLGSEVLEWIVSDLESVIKKQTENSTNSQE